MKYITLLILNFFDFFHKRKIFKFLKKKELTNFGFFFDVGAHKGESIISFGKNLSLNYIYSFEASSLSFKTLSKKIKILEKKLPKVYIQIENIALGSENRDIKFKHFEESSSSTIKQINTKSNYFKKKKKFLFGFNTEDYFKELIITQITLDDYLERKKIKNIDFLKIDTEGYEFEVIKGVKKNLKKIKIILFEHHYDDMIKKGYKFGDIHSFLEENNFEQIFKSKMPFRKTFEYIYKNKCY
tara:strand:+ start:282 stop:1007 length:726 start_codon:yes stop_codon:yes gene_type:complete